MGFNVVFVVVIHSIMTRGFEDFRAECCDQTPVGTCHVAGTALAGRLLPIVAFHAFAHHGEGVVACGHLNIGHLTVACRTRDAFINMNFVVHFDTWRWNKHRCGFG